MSIKLTTTEIAVSYTHLDVYKRQVPTLFKTARPDALIARITELHSYDVPAVVAWPIEKAHPLYAEWVGLNS